MANNGNQRDYMNIRQNIKMDLSGIPDAELIAEIKRRNLTIN